MGNEQIVLQEVNGQSTIKYEGKTLQLPTQELIRILNEYVDSLKGGIIVNEHRAFNLEEYIESLRKQDGSPLTAIEKENYANAVKNNGLASLSIKKDGSPTMSLVVPPLAHTSISNA